MKLLRVPEHVISHTLRALQYSWGISGHYHRSQGLADEVLAFGLVEGGIFYVHSKRICLLVMRVLGYTQLRNTCQLRGLNIVHDNFAPHL